ncbi:hypothetical protein CHS0354_008195 [Potamilus streckersoni]|uniref:Direct IAP-binding protein with low pI n=1 Tax=Potamilus streckersoni TaxID=2493646 RepID=A0AAE0VLB1_9BIVA|nr:hypothetical protein CHS0354_008195 [Potamilus streckersoni]
MAIFNWVSSFQKLFASKFKFQGCKQLFIFTRRHRFRIVNVGTMAATVAAVQEKQKLQMPDPSKLSTEYLIKSASVATVDSASALLTQTTVALVQAEKEYVQALFALTVLIEYKLKILGDETEENRIWNLIIEARALVKQAKLKKDNLELLMSIVKNLMTSAAEAAYLSGAEYAGISAGERLHSAERHVSAMSESEAAEAKLQEVQIRSIGVETKHAEDKERRKKKKENDSEHEESNSEIVYSESNKGTSGNSPILNTSNEADSLWQKQNTPGQNK